MNYCQKINDTSQFRGFNVFHVGKNYYSLCSFLHHLLYKSSSEICCPQIYQRKARENLSSASGLTFKYEDLNELDLVKEMAESLSQLLGKHVKALEVCC